MQTLRRTASVPALEQYRALAAQDATGEDIISTLNYALTLEHIENTFYATGLANIASADIEALGFAPDVVTYLAEIGAHEAAHVETLTTVITSLGGEPVAQGEYDFGDAVTDAQTFLATAAAVENLGVSAYTGAAQYLIDNDDLLTAALTIHGVEARHAAYLNILNGESPFPEAFDPPMTPAEVLEVAGPFVVSGDVVTPSAAGTPEADDGTPDA